MTDKTLNSEIQQYSEWRSNLSTTIQQLALFLKSNNVTDQRTHCQIESILGALADDRLSVAFVAEFSRGKSEMINSIFFGDCDQRILPSGAGRTTMCPTELLYDPDRPSSIRLLPIESRAGDVPLHELKNDASYWTEIKFDIQDTASLTKAMSGMTYTKLVSKSYAENLRFDIREDQESDYGLPTNEYDEVEIPCWRHAILNLPHPLLKQGIVILDTPGLNAIGAEPELTINQLATAHTVVFILSLDTGVTATDLTLWNDHLGGGTGRPKSSLETAGNNADDIQPNGHQHKLVALNKIDSLWDGIRSDEEIQAETDKQVLQTAKILNLKPENIFPVSAQKGLLGRLTRDKKLIKKSRIGDLEQALTEKLVPQKRQIVVAKVQNSLNGIIEAAESILDNRLNDADSHISELEQVNNKNTDVIAHIMLKVKSEKSSLEKDMQRYQELRSVCRKETTKLLSVLSEDRLEKLIAITKHNMARCVTSLNLQKIISKYFKTLNGYLDQAMEQSNKIALLSENITRNFKRGHGITSFQIRRLRLENFKQDIHRLELKYSHLKETKTLFFREQMSITNRFYESVCSASMRTFNHALRDANNWSNDLMVPMETYIREHHTQLRRRLESVKRIHKASDTAESRLHELQAMQTDLNAQYSEFSNLREAIAKQLLHVETENEDQPTSEPTSAEIIYWDHSINY